MSSSAPKRQLVADVAPFAYADAGLPGGAPGSAYDSSLGTEEQSRRQQAEVFEQGRQNAQQQLRSEFDAALIQHRTEIGRALHEFALERQNYYRRVEGEVVDLALAIARKILHRETQIDPHALAGIVRVTLEKLDIGTKVSLHVHPQEAADWRHYFACQVEGVPAPDVHEDPAIAPGECRIETSLGSTEVGLESQLKEIETGLLDLLAERPGSSPALTPAPTGEAR
ncbi:MAG TPA: FliH/SctL family protein [Terriglobales bacterium]|nr:FliH/SctL family protein [Terriglobales bacterium]